MTWTVCHHDSLKATCVHCIRDAHDGIDITVTDTSGRPLQGPPPLPDRPLTSLEVARMRAAALACGSSTKDTNPKDALGIARVPFSTVPARVMAEVGLAMLEGALKYGRHNYRISGVRASVYFDAVFRHLSAWWEGQDIDPDSGISHVTKAIAGLVVIRDSMMQGNWNDDRPPAVSDQNWVAEMNARAAAMIAKYPNPKAPHTQRSTKVD